ncbi:unnamed protein product [Amoebophrya sp. A120]|nr:unnamed protein product [Amoebophrya sp. A120]|eukprot:GSA120T00006528001.1
MECGVTTSDASGRVAATAAGRSAQEHVGATSTLTRKLLRKPIRVDPVDRFLTHQQLPIFLQAALRFLFENRMLHHAGCTADEARKAAALSASSASINDREGRAVAIACSSVVTSESPLAEFVRDDMVALVEAVLECELEQWFHLDCAEDAVNPSYHRPHWLVDEAHRQHLAQSSSAATSNAYTEDSQQDAGSSAEEEAASSCLSLPKPKEVGDWVLDVEPPAPSDLIPSQRTSEHGASLEPDAPAAPSLSQRPYYLGLSPGGEDPAREQDQQAWVSSVLFERDGSGCIPLHAAVYGLTSAPAVPSAGGHRGNVSASASLTSRSSSLIASRLMEHERTLMLLERGRRSTKSGFVEKRTRIMSPSTKNLAQPKAGGETVLRRVLDGEKGSTKVLLEDTPAQHLRTFSRHRIRNLMPWPQRGHTPQDQLGAALSQYESFDEAADSFEMSTAPPGVDSRGVLYWCWQLLVRDHNTGSTPFYQACAESADEGAACFLLDEARQFFGAQIEGFSTGEIPEQGDSLCDKGRDFTHVAEEERTNRYWVQYVRHVLRVPARNGMNVLHVACFNLNVPLVHFLLSGVRDVNNVEVIDAPLLDVNHANTANGCAPLHYTACNFGRKTVEVARLLLEAGADVHRATLQGETAVTQARNMSHNRTLVRLLTEYGAEESN